MASTGVNVLRWSALGFGVFYGFSHQATLTASSKIAAEHREYEHKKSLIEKAKAEYARKNNPSSGQGDGVISNPDDPKFDLEKYLEKVSKDNP